MRKKWQRFLKLFGPGFITGAADDDPSGVATYAQTGAQFGYGQLWLIVFLLPLQTAVQEACARIGAVTGRGLTAVVKRQYGMRVVWWMVVLVLLANTINIGADIGAMAEAMQLVTPFSFVQLTLGFTAFMLILEIFTSYRVYAKILKWLALTLLAYPLTVLIVAEPWGQLLRATFIPHIEWTFPFLFIVTGVLGTTISPYMFFWEASEEVEDEKESHLFRWGRPLITKRYVKAILVDNWVGMIFSGLGAWSIMVVAATVLNAHGVSNIATAADAAKALEPLVSSFPNAGFLSKLLFTVGIVGLGLLSIPILAGSAAYAIAEAFRIHEGLSLKLKQAHGFYGAITIATVLGLLINFVGIDPMKALVYTAVLNGVVAVPLIYIIARVAGNKKIMGKYRSGPLSSTFVWLAFGAMLLSAVGTLVMLLPH